MLITGNIIMNVMNKINIKIPSISKLIKCLDQKKYNLSEIPCEP